MLKNLEHEAAWMVELHPRGWSQVRQVRDVMRDHLGMLMDGKEPEWVAVAIRSSFEEAQTELKRIRKELREKKKELEADDGKS